MRYLSLAVALLLSVERAGSTDVKGVPPGVDMMLIVPAMTTPAPSSLTAVPGRRGVYHYIVLQWKDNTSNEYTFRVERCTGPWCKDFAEIAKLPRNTVKYIDNSVTSPFYKPGRFYRYRVRANGPQGLSAYSNIAKVSLPY